MKFSVIIPVFNRAHSIRSSLHSVLDQTRPPDEVIVVDDGSTDDLTEALAPYISRIVLLKQPNAGVAAARNLGVSRATGDWLTFQDSDDVWTRDHLASTERDLSSAAADVVVHLGDVLYTGKDYAEGLFDIKGLHYPSARAERLDDPLSLVISGMTLQGAAIRTDVFRRLGGFDTGMRMLSDTAFFCQIALEGAFLVTGDQMALIQRIEGDDASISGLHRMNARYSCEMQIRILERLLPRTMHSTQIAMVNRKLSGAYFRMAQVLTEVDPVSAKHVLVRSARQHPSILIGWGKALIAGLLGRSGYRLLRRQRRRIDRTV